MIPASRTFYFFIHALSTTNFLETVSQPCIIVNLSWQLFQVPHLSLVTKLSPVCEPCQHFKSHFQSQLHKCFWDIPMYRPKSTCSQFLLIFTITSQDHSTSLYIGIQNFFLTLKVCSCHLYFSYFICV